MSEIVLWCRENPFIAFLVVCAFLSFIAEVCTRLRDRCSAPTACQCGHCSEGDEDDTLDEEDEANEDDEDEDDDENR